jgi:hypothetical protein
MDVENEELRLLEEIARWTREAALPIVRQRVERLLDSDPKKRVYEALAEGDKTVVAVEKATGVNHSDIREWLGVWDAEDIIVSGSKPPKALFTLGELGIAPAPARTPRKRSRSS